MTPLECCFKLWDHYRSVDDSSSVFLALAISLNYNCDMFKVQATVAIIVNYDYKMFIVQARGVDLIKTF